MNPVLTRRMRPRRPLFGLGRRRRRVDGKTPIGRDFSGIRLTTPDRRWWAIALAVGVLAALAIVHVRVRLIEEGYLRAAAVERVETLLAKRQRLKAEVGTLRNRDRLNAFANERGFDKPQREIWLSPRTELRP